jgi:hypothetical protein
MIQARIGHLNMNAMIQVIVRDLAITCPGHQKCFLLVVLLPHSPSPSPSLAIVEMIRSQMFNVAFY